MSWSKYWVSRNLFERFQEIERPGGLSHLPLFFLALGFSLFGLLMIYSSSAILGFQQFDDSLLYFRKHLIFLGIGWMAYFVVAQLPILYVMRYRLPLLLLCFLLLLAVQLPGLGSSGGGAERWLDLGVLRFQPSELVRFLLIFYLAGTLVQKSERLQNFKKGFLPLLIVTTSLMLLLLVQPDFGGAMNIFLLSFGLWFIGGVSLPFLGGLGLLSLPAVAWLIFQEPYRAERIFSFIDPWADPQGSGFQVIQSLMAFYEGGWIGEGIGNGEQKLFYLPKAHNDFIFSVVGEEMGVLGVALVISLFLGLLVFGAQIARYQLSRKAYLLSIGLVLFFCIPALLNMMVTLGMLPTKGLPLPFFSSGGTSLVVSLMALGGMQSLYRYRHLEERNR